MRLTIFNYILHQLRCGYVVLSFLIEISCSWKLVQKVIGLSLGKTTAGQSHIETKRSRSLHKCVVAFQFRCSTEFSDKYKKMKLIKCTIAINAERTNSPWANSKWIRSGFVSSIDSEIKNDLKIISFKCRLVKRLCFEINENWCMSIQFNLWVNDVWKHECPSPMFSWNSGKNSEK